jgi:hypothetical protein
MQKNPAKVRGLIKIRIQRPPPRRRNARPKQFDLHTFPFLPLDFQMKKNSVPSLIPGLHRCATRGLRYTILSLALSAATLNAAPYYGAWVQEYQNDPTAPTWNNSQGATAIGMDKSGNVFVTGYAKNTSDVNRFYTVKYDALDGHILWEMFEESGNTIFTPNALVVDSAGDVIVTGSRNAAGAIDYYTVKYSGVNGARVWPAAMTYDGTAGGEDTALKVVVDGNDDVIVTGRSAGSGSAIDIVTIKYAKADGAQIGATDRYTTAGTRDDFPGALAVDGASNVIVAGTATTGSGIRRFYVRKLTSMLAVAWDITPIDTGGDGGATGVAVDSANNVVATGLYRDGNSRRGYYTAKFAASNGNVLWKTNTPPISADLTAAPTGVAIGPDNYPVVTGFMNDASGTTYIRTIKYTPGGSGGNASVFWDRTDTGLGKGDSFARQIITDGASNTILVGETDQQNAGSGFSTDLYLAKYDANTGAKLYSATYGGTWDADHTGTGVAIDANGSVALAGIEWRRVNNTGRTGFATIKFNRLIADTGDPVPGIADATFAGASTPALGDNGALAAKVTILSAKKKTDGILTETAATGSSLPAVQNGTAPDTGGLGKYKSLSDPIIAPNGRYAFAAKLTGVPGPNGEGVWTNLSGTLKLALQKGKPVPGIADANVSAVASLSMRNDRLIALLKVTGPAPSSMVLLSLDAANNGTVLLRTGSDVTVDNKASTIKKITVLSPAKLSPGDGRWQGDGSVVASATLADKRTVLFRITTAGALTRLLATDQDASGVVNGAAWKTFSLPAIGTGGTRFAALGTLAVKKDTVTAKNDTALVYSANGAAFTPFAKEGSAPSDANLSTFLYSGFSDPLVNASGKVAFLGTFKGAGVKASNGTALFYGDPAMAIPAKARLGSKATNSAGVVGGTDDPVWAGFISFAQPGGATGPIFVAKLSGGGVTAKNNLGIWGINATGKVRLLLRTGDQFDERTVAKFQILNVVPTAFSAARSFNGAGSIAVLITFTDKTQGIITLANP